MLQNIIRSIPSNFLIDATNNTFENYMISTLQYEDFNDKYNVFLQK